MKIDYYCFVMDNFGQKDYSNLMARYGAHIFENMDFDVATAKSLGKFAVFCKETQKFYDDSWQEINLNGKVVLPRCIIPETKTLFDAIEAQGALSLESKEDFVATQNWPALIHPIYREVIPTTYGEFLENFEEYKKKFGRVFFKTAKKHISCEVRQVMSLNDSIFAFVEDDDDLLNDKKKESKISEKMYLVFTNQSLHSNDHRFNFLPKDANVYVQPYLEIVKDEQYSNIPVEYRSFVVDGKFTTSRSWVPNREVPETVVEMTQQIIDAMPERTSKTFVVDVLQFVDENGQTHYDLCELNPISSSGYEQGSSIFLLEDGLAPERKFYPKCDSVSEEVSES